VAKNNADYYTGFLNPSNVKILEEGVENLWKCDDDENTFVSALL
jgi:hypothetical protein